MNIKKGLLASAAAAFAVMALAAPAMGEGGVIRHVEAPNEPIPNGTEVPFEGWVEFHREDGVGVICHAKATAVATGTSGETGHVKEFEAFENTCEVTELTHCDVVSVEETNQPYHLTATPEDLDVTGDIEIHNDLSGFLCPDVTATFSSVTLLPLQTGTRTVTNTDGNLGGTALGAPIAGVELEGTGEGHSSFGETFEIEATGELEITDANIDTWKLE